MEGGQIAFGLALIVFGVGLVGATIGKPKEWTPRLSRLIWIIGWPQAQGRDKVRALGYIASAVGLLELIRAVWFPT